MVELSAATTHHTGSKPNDINRGDHALIPCRAEVFQELDLLQESSSARKSTCSCRILIATRRTLRSELRCQAPNTLAKDLTEKIRHDIPLMRSWSLFQPIGDIRFESDGKVCICHGEWLYVVHVSSRFIRLGVVRPSQAHLPPMLMETK